MIKTSTPRSPKRTKDGPLDHFPFHRGRPSEQSEFDSSLYIPETVHTRSETCLHPVAGVRNFQTPRVLLCCVQHVMIEGYARLRASRRLNWRARAFQKISPLPKDIPRNSFHLFCLLIFSLSSSLRSVRTRLLCWIITPPRKRCAREKKPKRDLATV